MMMIYYYYPHVYCPHDGYYYWISYYYCSHYAYQIYWTLISRSSPFFFPSGLDDEDDNNGLSTIVFTFLFTRVPLDN
jgi:hypothetical protein